MKKANNQRTQSPYQIFRVLTEMVSRDEPAELFLKNVEDYCRTINDVNRETFTAVIDSEGAVDLPKFLETYSKTFACPIIYYNGQRRADDTIVLMRKLFKFLRANGLNKKHLITFNFPANSNELLKCKAAGFSPNNMIKVIKQLSHVVPVKESDNLLNKNLVEVESYFQGDMTVSRIVNLYGPQNIQNEIVNISPRFTLTDSVEENCHLLKNAIDQYTYTSSLNLGSGFHLQRIIFLGQIGSGRKTQARLLAKRWHLVFLDFRVILLEYAKLNKCFADSFMKVQSVHKLSRKLMASILFERITRRDCLENGWILVGFVSSAADLEIMEKQFHIIPNKIMFIHCRQYLCLDRLRDRIIKKAELRYSNKDTKYAKLGFLDLFSPCCAISHIMTEMDHFCRNRREILKYCHDQAKCIAHVDGEHSVATVTTLLLGQLEKFNF